MQYLVLASDYDGTLATHGAVDDATLAAAKRLLESGRKLVLVTGRELDELLTVFPAIEICEWVVAENGALLYHPATRRTVPLGERPPDEFIRELDRRGVQPYSVGHVIVATWTPHETTVLEVVRDLGLELQVIFNKGAVMILPSGINKATGLRAALKEMDLSPHNVVGVGDAENDHALLALCECGVAVENALPVLKERADLVTSRDHGAGVRELIDLLLEDDLRQLTTNLDRHFVLLGRDDEGQEISVEPWRTNLLIAGTSGGGKSTLATGFVERLAEKQYQYCIIDPEGDYQDFDGTVSTGSKDAAPDLDELIRLLEDPKNNAVANLVGVPLGDRPRLFQSLLTRLQEMRSRLGHPHWIVVDEAHHVLPAAWEPSALAMPTELSGMLFVTLQGEELAMEALDATQWVIAVGDAPQKTFDAFAQAVGEQTPEVQTADLEHGEVLVWQRGKESYARRMRVAPSKAVRKRHSRKYAEGELPRDRSFFFTGPEGKLKLRAQNLIVFLQMADGVDDETWLFHLAQSDYSRWFRDCIKDDSLADEAQRIEHLRLSAEESRARIKELVEQRYTLPASAGLPASD